MKRSSAQASASGLDIELRASRSRNAGQAGRISHMMSRAGWFWSQGVSTSGI